MTPLELIRQLKEELEALYRDTRLPDSMGALKAPAVYLNELPLVESTSESLPDEYASPPYIIVRSTGWSGGFTGEPRSVDVMVLYSVYCSEKNRDGCTAILNMFERLYMRFCKNRYIGNFEIDGDVNCALTDEDTYPYFFGGASMKFLAPSVVCEDPLA